MHTITVSAYVDPSVMTYTIQAMAGILIALGSVIGVGWRRIQKKLSIFDMSITSVESDRLFYRDPATGEETLIDVPEENPTVRTDTYHIGDRYRSSVKCCTELFAYNLWASGNLF